MLLPLEEKELLDALQDFEHKANRAAGAHTNASNAEENRALERLRAEQTLQSEGLSATQAEKQARAMETVRRAAEQAIQMTGQARTADVAADVARFRVEILLRKYPANKAAIQ